MDPRQPNKDAKLQLQKTKATSYFTLIANYKAGLNPSRCRQGSTVTAHTHLNFKLNIKIDIFADLKQRLLKNYAEFIMF